MVLINKEKLNLGAINDPQHPQHKIAKFYMEGCNRLRETYGRYIRFVDTKQPRYTRGADGQGNDIPKMKEPDTITRVPLSAKYEDKERGTERWACCIGDPVIHPNGQYDLGAVRAITVGGDKIVDMDKDMDLAFFMAFISPLVRSKNIKIDNPQEDAKRVGDKKRAEADRIMAIWHMLTDEDKLRTMAQAYGVTNVYKKRSGSQSYEKEPDVIREELEKILTVNDEKRKNDLSVRGTKEFLDELKVKDNVLLRAFVQQAMDDRLLEYHVNGDWKVGDRYVVKVPQQDIDKKFDYLCNYLGSTNNVEKLKTFLGDVINKDYLAEVRNPRVFEWLARVNDINIVAKTKETIRQKIEEVYGGSNAE